MKIFLGILAMIFTATNSFAQNTSNTPKTLIAYFSYTGNTKGMAETIQQITGGDLLRIETETPYSNEYKVVEKQGYDEQKAGYLPPIKTIIDNPEQYNTVIIGSPIWWYNFAPAVKTFLKENDFSGKKVALFVTHGGYGPGSSFQTLQDLCPKCNIVPMFDIEDKTIKSSEKQIQEWLENNNLVRKN